MQIIKIQVIGPAYAKKLIAEAKKLPRAVSHLKNHPSSSTIQSFSLVLGFVYFS